MSSENLNNLHDGVRKLQSKGSDLDSSYDETKPKGSGSRVVCHDQSDLDNSLVIGSKFSDGVVSDDKFNLDKCSGVMSDEETVHHYINMALRFRRKKE